MDTTVKSMLLAMIALEVWNGSGAPLQAQTFTEVAAILGMNAPGPGASWGDYDSDRDLDLYVASFGAPNLLYRNNGDGTFTEVAESAGVNDPGTGVAVACGDYDNDGDLDLYVGNQDPANRKAVNRLYRNNDNGTFTDVGIDAGVSEPGNWGAPAWGDYDNDGNLDLYETSLSGPGRLYRNRGNGTFVNLAGVAGIIDDPTLQVRRGPAAWGDFDRDGDLDLFVTSPLTSQFYRNNGDGTLTEVAAAAGIYDEPGFAVAWGDFDNDEHLDLYVTNQGFENRLYKNNGDGTFTEVGVRAGVDSFEGGGHGVAWGDFDNDGDLDLHVIAHVGSNRLYQNNGDGTFTDVAITAGVNYETHLGGAQTWGDYDDDGDLDLYVANVNPEPNQLYRNEGTPNHWLHIKLQGTVSNRSAIGTRVIAVAGTKRQVWEVDGGSGFCGQASLPVEFGFGQTTMVDSLIIRWPSGIVQTFTDLETNQRLAIVESNLLITAVEEEEEAARPSTFSLSQNYPNPFNPQTTIHYEVPEEAEIRLTILDLAGQQVRTLAEGTHQPGQYRAVWDGTDASGRGVASGVYVYRLEVKGQGVIETKRMALVR